MKRLLQAHRTGSQSAISSRVIHGYVSCSSAFSPPFQFKAIYSVETVFLVNALFRALAGLSQGMTGGGGPARPSLLPTRYSIQGAIHGLSGLTFITCGNEMCGIADARTSRSCSCITAACSNDIYCSHGSRLLLSRCGVPRLVCSPSLTPCPAFIHFSEIHLYAGLCVTALLETFAQGTPRATAL